jgi:RNA polymerase sigma factor (sigma-70 family)
MCVSSTGVSDVTANPILQFLNIFRRTALLHESQEQSDAQLLDRFVGGDGVALETLVRRHAAMVWGVCRRNLTHHDDAEDAFQATFLVLLRKAASLRSRELLANWLYGVAYKTACKARQTAAKRYAREKQVEAMPEPPAETSDDTFAAELLGHLDRELSGLPEKYRRAIVLCDLQGRTLRDAAQQLRVAEGTVGSRLARGREMLAQRMSRHGAGLSAGAVAAVCSQQAASGAVPTALLTRTIDAVRLMAAGQPVMARLLKPEVSPLTESVLRAMAGAKRKVVGAVLLLAGLVMGGGLVTYHVLANQPNPPEQQAEQVPPTPNTKQPVPDPGPDPKMYGMAAAAKNFAITYLLDAINDHLPGTPSHRDTPRFSPCWPSRAIEATLDPTTHEWTVSGVYRREINAKDIVWETWNGHAYAGRVPPWTPQEKGWLSCEKDWKLVLSFNPSARAFEVKKAEGVERMEESLMIQEGKLWLGNRRLARTDDFGKWLQGEFPKPKASAAPVTALRLVLDVPERAQFGLEPKYSYENNKMDIDSDSRGVRVSIDDHGAGEQVERWTLHFGAAPGHSLRVGEYGGAYYCSDRPAPHIQVSHHPGDKDKPTWANNWGLGLGEFLGFGEFVVREIELEDKKVVRLAIDFITDTGYGRPSTDKRGGIKGKKGWATRSIVRGSLRYNSKFEPSIPELDRGAAE